MQHGFPNFIPGLCQHPDHLKTGYNRPSAHDMFSMATPTPGHHCVSQFCVFWCALCDVCAIVPAYEIGWNKSDSKYMNCKCGGKAHLTGRMNFFSSGITLQVVIPTCVSVCVKPTVLAYTFHADVMKLTLVDIAAYVGFPLEIGLLGDWAT